MAMYREIPGYSRYEIDHKGAIRLKKPTAYLRAGHMLKPVMLHGYAVYNLISDTDQRKVVKRARLVLIAWDGPPPRPGMHCRHLNDIPTDDNIGNLAWGTASENMQDKRRNRNRDLTPAEQAAVLQEGLTDDPAAVAARYGLTEKRVLRMTRPFRRVSAE